MARPNTHGGQRPRLLLHREVVLALAFCASAMAFAGYAGWSTASVSSQLQAVQVDAGFVAHGIGRQDRP